MKTRYIPYILVFLLLVGGIYLGLRSNSPMEENISGHIETISTETERRLTIRTDDATSSVAVNENTVYTDSSGEEVSFDYLRRGYEVDVRGYTADGVLVAETIDVTNEPDVLIFQPQRGAVVTSPIQLSGEARGTWYFEASFSARIENSQGDVIAEVPVQAQGEWMTEDYVPFETEIEYSSASVTPGSSGALVIEKANPSGLPENADEIEIPIQFAEQENTTVSVFFGRDIVGTDIIECDAVFEVQRTVDRTQAVARAALTELLEGPTQEEIEQGRYVTNIPEGVEIQSLEIRDGTAYADFSQALQENVGGSCRVTAIRAQIEETLLQFESVDDVVISIDGETETILQP